MSLRRMAWVSLALLLLLAAPDSSDQRGWRVPEDGPDFIHDLSMMESEYFAATAVHAGSWRRESDFSVIRYATSKIPLSIFVGDRDAFFPVSSVRATEAALKEGGFDAVEVTVIKGHTHWYYDAGRGGRPDDTREHKS